ncbi:antibiotic biosynthesis monooxygenase [Sphingomonas sp. AOB5]|uniref:putative quinol monooxygenase n=1 Tax=Sphingomonas sp. AOB5 TaxID=3034017 RepID=UPI0023F63931|nr:antibiotic biosynthesis monooxygenase [Sphingomonas sp. AOB5]MDF7776723.1 antibiotic biosynthesis monooxygenase [Sphingomonas sp. AOB5]
MTILRHYKMQAAEGRGDELKTVLADLAAKVSPLAGCEKVELFADPRDADTYMFVEHWAGIDDHKAAGAALGKEAFAPVMAVLAGPPEGRYLEAVALA